MKNNLTRKKIRWWPAAIVLALDALLLIWIWVFFDAIRQDKIINTILLQIVALFLLILWLLFSSRLRWKIRLTTFAVLLLTIGLFIALFQVREFSGDLMPIVEWRWQSDESSSPKPKMAAKVNEIIPDMDSDPLSYPQFLGKNRDAEVTGIRLATNWETEPPELLWRQPIGEGWSSFAIAGNYAITQEQAESQELVVCYDLKTGAIYWSHSDEARYETPLAGVGPRATPTIDSNRVYTLGATGKLNCLDLYTGEKIWAKNILDENDAQIPEWGVSCSPLVIDTLLVVCAGGKDNRSLVAYHKNSGKLIWSGGDDLAGYSSPMIATLAGVRQILIFNNSHVVGHNPLTGEILWKFPWPPETQKVAQPVILPDDRVFIGTGYGVGSKLIQIRNNQGSLTPTLLWESKRMKPKFTNVVFHEGFIYGLDDGILACIDAKDGKRKWKRGRYGHGQMILVHNVLLISTENGNIVLVEAKPDGHHELARNPAIKGKTWNTPALSGSYRLVRNHREAACLKLPTLK